MFKCPIHFAGIIYVYRIDENMNMKSYLKCGNIQKGVFHTRYEIFRYKI